MTGPFLIIDGDLINMSNVKKIQRSFDGKCFLHYIDGTQTMVVGERFDKLSARIGDAMEEREKLLPF